MSPTDFVDRSPFRVTVLATGGTLEKSYDARSGQLSLAAPVIDGLLEQLDMPDVAVRVERLMAKDSLDMTDADRQAIVAEVQRILDEETVDAVLVTHGTDTLADTAMALHAALAPAAPVVLTGAMRPYRVAASDGLQNVAQALMAARLLAPGVYAVMHGRAIAADRVCKDYERLTLTTRA
ncbi:asparaginase domain-containing protein [Salinisphaera sp.]|uniref:asparaginase domain-containing protein n=1 Tax=Salinisphaera sp. TaxID=1914330 RepID=UPI000C5D0FE1|nr:asparaginase domain-containing protein [Salinisphaera sp.]MBS64362.1 asparaginase [Salinisphaera sp.]